MVESCQKERCKEYIGMEGVIFIILSFFPYDSIVPSSHFLLYFIKFEGGVCIQPLMFAPSLVGAWLLPYQSKTIYSFSKWALDSFFCKEYAVFRVHTFIWITVCALLLFIKIKIVSRMETCKVRFQDTLHACPPLCWPALASLSL